MSSCVRWTVERGSWHAALLAALMVVLAPACAGEEFLDEIDVDETYAEVSWNGGLCGGEPCDAVIRGALRFVDRTPDGLGGNGRSCADCHMVADQFQLSPANAEARFQRLLARRRRDPHADDPLFRPIDADDFRVNGQGASDYGNLRQNGLIRITFSLPPNVRLIDPATDLPSGETFVDVWRAVPSVLNVKRTGADPDPPSWFRPPNPRGGYQLDARLADLQEQALGAFLVHAEVQDAPGTEALDDLASFQNVAFSSHRMFAASRAIDEGIDPPDPDPPLDSLEQQGKAVFIRACAHCHGGVSGVEPGPGIHRFGGVQAQCPRPVDAAVPPRFAFAPCPQRLARNVRTYEITGPTGAVIRRSSSDPGRTLLSGFAGGPPPLDDWNALDVPTTRGMARTAPYFHNNSAATLEELLDHYTEFFRFVAATAPPPPAPRPPAISTDGIHIDRPFTADERLALLAYLRVH